MEDARKQFLEAEAQADALLKQLVTLKEKMAGHAEAEVSLEKARESLIQTNDEMTKIAEEVRAVIDTLGKIGTPEILDTLKNGITEIQVIIEDKSENDTASLIKLKQFVWAAIGIEIVIVTLIIVLLLRL